MLAAIGVLSRRSRASAAQDLIYLHELEHGKGLLDIAPSVRYASPELDGNETGKGLWGFLVSGGRHGQKDRQLPKHPPEQYGLDVAGS